MPDRRKMNLNELIERAGGVVAVARAADVREATVYGWKKAGALGPRVGYPMTIKLARILGVEPEDIVRDTGEAHA